jgi:hypothetical protein
MPRVDVEDEDDDVAELHYGYAKKCAAAHENTRTPVALGIVGALYAQVPDLIESLSADGDHVPSDALKQVESYWQHLTDAAADAKQIVLEASVKAYGEGVSGAKIKQMEDAFLEPVQKMAETGLEAYEKHILLKKRETYDPNNNRVVPDIADVKKEDIGCTLAAFTMAMKREFVEYQQDVEKIHAADAKLPPVPAADERKRMRPDDRAAAMVGRVGYLRPSEYWRSKLSKWKLLAPVALWHLGFPTSSIAMERVFARMRMMGVPQRLSADNATFSRELRFRANQPLVNSMVQET